MLENIKLLNFKRLSKRMVSLLLVFILSFSFLLGNVEFKTFAASYDDCSAAGDGSLKWSLSEDQTTLTFTGYGAMKDYAPMKRNPIPPPWLSAKDSITTIKFKSDDENGGITKIGNGAFVKFSKLENIEFPESLEEIGVNAFTETSLPRIINLSNTQIKKIGDSAFTNCGNVKEVFLPGTVTNIGVQAFSQMRDLKAVYITDILSAEAIKNLNISANAFDYNPIKTSDGSASIIVNNEELKNAFNSSSNKSGYKAIEKLNIYSDAATGSSGLQEIEWGSTIPIKTSGGDENLTTYFFVENLNGDIASIQDGNLVVNSDNLGNIVIWAFKSNQKYNTLKEATDAYADGKILTYNMCYTDAENPISIVPTKIVDEDLTQNFDDIVLENGATLEDISELLKENATFRLNSGMVVNVPIVWDADSFKYDPDSTDEQTFVIKGVFDEEPRVSNIKDAVVKVKVTVEAFNQELVGGSNDQEDYSDEEDYIEPKNYDEEHYDEEYYETGDNRNITPLAILMTLSLSSLVVLVYNRKKEENK